MNIIAKTAIASLLTVSFYVSASAQDSKKKELQKAIVIEKDFVPVETKVNKPDVLPEEAPIVAQTVNLSFSDWAVPSQVDPLLIRQSPIRYNDPNLQAFRKRGYLHFGAGNYLNMVGSAGYRILDGNTTQLGVWLQHNSTNGRRSSDYAYKQFVADERLGMDFTHKLQNGTLSADASYRFSKFNYYNELTSEVDPIPDSYLFGNKKQSINEFNIGLKWENDVESTSHFYAGADFNYLGFGYAMPATTPVNDYGKGLKEYQARAFGGAEFTFGDNSFIGMDGNFQFFNYDYPQGIIVSPVDNGYQFRQENAFSFGMLSFTPYYRKTTERTNLRIGARVDISVNNGTVFRIAPDVRFDAQLSDKVGLFIAATGGNKVNTFSELTARNRYLHASLTLPNSYTMVDARAGLNLGLWKGLSLTPYVGFSVAKDKLVPYYRQNLQPHFQQPLYQGVDLNGWMAGLRFGYKFKSLFELTADYTYAPQDADKGYVLSDDSAEHNFKASLSVTPIKALSIRIDYDLRAMRTLRYTAYLSQLGGVDTYDSTLRLGNISNLNIGAHYAINDMIGVFVQGNNLLNREYDNYLGLYAQKLNVMGGITLNF